MIIRFFLKSLNHSLMVKGKKIVAFWLDEEKKGIVRYSTKRNEY